MTVLVVDDSRVTREVTKCYLIGKGVTLLDARHGEDALKVIRERRPDVVIADLQMPRMDGPGLCEALQADAELRKLPVIILTSNVDARSRERCLKAGAKEVLSKPVQPTDLIAAIRRHLGRPSPL
jgi:CheY-like chemotaxis protein